jgi:nucleoside-diphosphate-sugar epimerase
LRTKVGYDVICLDRFYFGEDIVSPISVKIHIVKDDIRTFDPSLLNRVDAVLDLASLSNDSSGELDSRKTREINYKVAKRTLPNQGVQGKKVLFVRTRDSFVELPDSDREKPRLTLC